MLVQPGPKRVKMGKEDKYQVIDLGVSLAKGSLRRARVKYAESTRREAIERVVASLEDESVPLGDWSEGEVQIIGLHRVVTTPYWVIPVYTVLFPPREEDGAPVVGTYQVVEWNIGRDVGAAVLLRTVDNEFVLVRSYKHAKRAWTIELPRGTRMPDEAMEECAIREAQEEVGAILTKTSRMFPLGITDPDTGVLGMDPEILMITDVIIDESKISRDVSESVLGPVVLSLTELYEMVRDGVITDGFTSAALMKAQLKGLIEPPRAVPVRASKPVLEKCVSWMGPGFNYDLKMSVCQDARIEVFLGLEDWVGSPPCFNGILADDLERVIRYLRRKSRRNDGMWKVRLQTLHGSTAWMGEMSDQRYGGHITEIKFEMSERKHALAVASTLQEIKVEQERIRAELSSR